VGGGTGELKGRDVGVEAAGQQVEGGRMIG